MASRELHRQLRALAGLRKVQTIDGSRSIFRARPDRPA
jgi:hypothetical protein